MRISDEYQVPVRSSGGMWALGVLVAAVAALMAMVGVRLLAASGRAVDEVRAGPPRHQPPHGQAPGVAPPPGGKKAPPHRKLPRETPRTGGGGAGGGPKGTAGAGAIARPEG